MLHYTYVVCLVSARSRHAHVIRLQDIFLVIDCAHIMACTSKCCSGFVEFYIS